MPNAMAVNEGLLIQMDSHVANLLPGCEVRLYINDLTLQPAHVLNDFVPATFTGSTPQATPTWGAPAMNGNRAESAHGPLVFTNAGGNTGETVYGWLLVQTATGKVIVAKPLDTAVLMNTNGKSVIVAPVFTLGDDPGN